MSSKHPTKTPYSKTLVIDIGGTNTRIAMAVGPRIDPDSVRRFRNSEIGTLGAAIAAYRTETGAQPYAVCVAGAGPVRDAVLQLTNLDWVIDRAMLRAATGAEVISILNDLQAQGHALDTLPADSLTDILPGAPAGPQAARLVINVGTGMNIAPVYRLNGQTLVPPSEAGHALVPAQTEEELRLSEFLTSRHGFPSVEEVLSGRGIEALYAFVSGKERSAAEIMDGLESDEKARHALRLFIGILGRVAGNMTLITLPFGGVYFVGGVMRHVTPYLLEMGFAEAFADKGRFGPFMAQFPVRVVSDDYAALMGCAAHMAELMG
jgi:glucokinase